MSGSNSQKWIVIAATILVGVFLLVGVLDAWPLRKGPKKGFGNVRTDISMIGMAISTFVAIKGRLPESLDELAVEGTDGAALLDKRNLKDPWGTPFQYKKITKYKYEVRSAGPDRQINTDDDITN